MFPLADGFCMPGSASPLPEVFRDLSVYRLLAFGALMMVIMIVRPQGCCPKAVPDTRTSAATVATRMSRDPHSTRVGKSVPFE